MKKCAEGANCKITVGLRRKHREIDNLKVGFGNL